MKTTRSVLLSLTVFWACVTTGRAQNASWGIDSNTEFAVGVNGTGKSGGGSYSSPSGLWDVSFEFSYFQLGPNYEFHEGETTYTYLPTGQNATAFPWDAGFPTNSSYGSYIDGFEGSLAFANWDGGLGFISVFPPTAQNPSGSWNFELSASGPALPIPEPDPMYLVGFGLLGLTLVARARER
jgi:hypothetical protein